MNGRMIIPKGGKINDPKITAKAAPFSPSELPPYFLTDRELANILDHARIMVKTAIAIQKNKDNSFELIKKW